MPDIADAGRPFPDSIDHYPAGPELDCLLAERVLGARIARYKEWTGYENVVATDPAGTTFFIIVSPHSPFEPLWNPSTNPSDAKELARYLYSQSDYRSMSEDGSEEDGNSITLWAHRPLETEVTGVGPGDGRQLAEIWCVRGYGPTPALAVCRAVYKAVSDVRPHVDSGKERE
jgi:hypothetical protein